MRSFADDDLDKTLEEYARLLRNQPKFNKDDEPLILVAQGLKQAVNDLLCSGKRQKEIEVMGRLVYEHIVGEAIAGSKQRENHF